MGVLGTEVIDVAAAGVAGEFDALLTSSDFFGVEKVDEFGETVGCDGDTIGFALSGAVTFVCFRRGTVDFVASELVTVS